MNVSDYLIARLSAWGVRRVYGYPGDGINGILGALNRNDHGIRFIQARHEETAAFMACGHAKFTDEVGVCLATSGPGAIHLLNGLYDAKMDHVPVVALVGQSARTAIGGDYQQEVDLHTLFKDVAHEYVHTCMSAEACRHLVDRAFRIAKAERTVTCLIFPKDVQELEARDPPRAHDTVHSSVSYSSPLVVPTDGDLRRAAAVLNAGEKVAMLVGNGARSASEEVLSVATALQAGVAKALLGLAVLPDDLPFVTGPIGLLGTRPSWEMMNACDTLLVVGSSFPYAEFLPKEGRARAVQIDLDGRMLGMRYPIEVNLVGDAAETLRALWPQLRGRKVQGPWRADIARWNAEWQTLMHERAHLEAKGINPQRVFWELSPQLPDGCILTADSGSAANWFARDLKLRQGMMASLSGGLATMGPAVPYAIAAKFAHPRRPVIALVGDGAMQMNGNAELITVARHWREWADPRLIVLVLRNDDLNMVTWEMRALEGDPRYAASQDIPPFPYAEYAKLIGLHGIRVDRSDEVAKTWRTALEADRPVVIEAIVDPDVPPIPPHITLKEARAFGLSVVRSMSEPGEVGVLKQAVQNLFPRIGQRS